MMKFPKRGLNRKVEHVRWPCQMAPAFEENMPGGTVVHLVNRQELLCPVGVWLCTLASIEGLIPSHASYI